MISDSLSRLKKLNESLRAENEKSKQKLAKLKTERALGRYKSSIEDFIDDLVHRPPNKEQFRQMKQCLEEQQQLIAALLKIINDWESKLSDL